MQAVEQEVNNGSSVEEKMDSEEGQAANSDASSTQEKDPEKPTSSKPATKAQTKSPGNRRSQTRFQKQNSTMTLTYIEKQLSDCNQRELIVTMVDL